MYDPYTVTNTSGVWTGTNGLYVEEIGNGESAGLENGGSAAPNNRAAGAPNNGGVRAAHSLRLRVRDAARDPLFPKFAAARIHGLPAHGFLKVTLDRPLDGNFWFSVDLLDRRGQRFIIWENAGVSRYHPEATEIWLNLDDFGVHFWGHCSADPVFRPADVEELQLHCFITKPSPPRTVSFSVMAAR